MSNRYQKDGVRLSQVLQRGDPASSSPEEHSAQERRAALLGRCADDMAAASLTQRPERYRPIGKPWNTRVVGGATLATVVLIGGAVLLLRSRPPSQAVRPVVQVASPSANPSVETPVPPRIKPPRRQTKQVVVADAATPNPRRVPVQAPYQAELKNPRHRRQRSSFASPTLATLAPHRSVETSTHRGPVAPAEAERQPEQKVERIIIVQDDTPARLTPKPAPAPPVVAIVRTEHSEAVVISRDANSSLKSEEF